MECVSGEPERFIISIQRYGHEKKEIVLIVETARGVEYGTVIITPGTVAEDQVVQPLKPVIRVATPEDDKVEAKNKEKEKQAYIICQEKIKSTVWR